MARGGALGAAHCDTRPGKISIVLWSGPGKQAYNQASVSVIWLNARTGVPVVELILQVDTGSEEADGSDGEPLLAALHGLHQFGHQPPLQYVAFDPEQCHTVFKTKCPQVWLLPQSRPYGERA